MSSGAKQTVHYIKEATVGTTPSMPSQDDWKTMRFTSCTLTPSPTVERSEEIEQGRMPVGSVVTAANPAGNVVGELSYGSFDDWLEALFYDTWTSDVLTAAGTTVSTFSVQKGYTDAANYHIFRGVHVATGQITIPESGKVMVTFGCLAMDYASAGTKYSSLEKAADTTPFMSSLSVGAIKLNSSPIGACVSAMTINIDNSLVAKRCLGSGKLGPGSLTETQALITGSMTINWSAAAYAIWKEQMARTTFSVEFPITDSLGNKYEFDFPALEFDGDLPDGGNTDVIEATLNFTAVGTAPKITRTDHA